MKLQYLTVIIVLMFIVYIWESESREWRQVRVLERQELNQMLYQQKQRKKWSQAEMNIIHIQGEDQESLLYKPNVSNVQIKGHILFIFGTWGNITHWDDLLQKLANKGFFIAAMNKHHTLNPTLDIEAHMELWSQLQPRMIKLSTEECQRLDGDCLNQALDRFTRTQTIPSIVIGHSYGGMLAQFICQNSCEFKKLLLISPFFGLHINPSLFSLELLYNIQNKNPTSYELQRKPPSVQLLIQSIQYQKAVQKCDFIHQLELGLILSLYEDLVSNKKSLELYENSNAVRKSLFISKYITHYSKNDHLLKIITQFLI